MKQKSMTAAVNLPTDSEALKEQIRQLQAKGFKVTRPTVHQIKVAKYNWYWGTGKITIDPCRLHKFRGFEAFVELIETDRDWTSKRPKVLNFPRPLYTETL